MDNQMKTIIVLIICVIILVGVFLLKTTKNSEIEVGENIIVEQEIKIEQEDNLGKEEIIEKIQTNNAKETRKFHFDISDIIIWYISFSIKHKLVIFIITMILNIGIAKMYSKIGMPMWTIIFQIASPFLSLINASAVTLGVNILKFASAVMLFILLDAFKIELGSKKNIFVGAIAGVLVVLLFVSKFNIIYTLMSTSIILVLTLIAMFHVKMCLNLAENFDKEQGFKFGLIFLPSIFQAILGYQRKG